MTTNILTTNIHITGTNGVIGLTCTYGAINLTGTNNGVIGLIGTNGTIGLTDTIGLTGASGLPGTIGLTGISGAISFDFMINEIERMKRENNFNEEILAYYYSVMTYDISNKLYQKLKEINYPSKFFAKNYYCLMVLIVDDYFEVPIDIGMTRFCSIIKKLNIDVLQTLANIMAKSSRTVILNVTDANFLKLLRI